MKQIIETIKAWLHARRERMASEKAARREYELTAASRSVVQVKEFGGEVFLAFDGTPLLPIDGLKWDVPTTLDVAREAYVKYGKMEKLKY